MYSGKFLMIGNSYKLVLFTLLLSLAGCSSNPPAPVIDRLPSNKTIPADSSGVAKTPAKPISGRPTYKAGDWRPDTYIVKKGDTLFSIGLEHGYDYKEIAQANNIPEPYHIRVGQSLKLNTLKDKPTASETTASQANSDGVLITPINTEPSAAATSNNVSTPSKPTVLAINEPKAIREPYSDDAFKKAPPAAKSAITKSADDKTIVATVPDAANKAIEPKTDVKPDVKLENKSESTSVDDIDWAWPTKGKISANFNEGGGKGMDIAGTTGQTIIAAAAGKVIYSGSDLRGYGKLVIIKHNASYLSVYAHNSQIVVKEGQQVSRGQKIAEMGNTDSNTVKLHFEIRRQGKSVDPSKYLTNN